MRKFENFSHLLTSAITAPLERHFTDKKSYFLFCQLKLEVDNSFESRSSYRIKLKYGNNEWSVIRSTFEVLSLQKVFKKKVENFKDIIFLAGRNTNEDLEGLLESINVEADRIDIPELFTFYSVCRYSFKGEYIYEELFDVKMKGFEDLPYCGGYCGDTVSYLKCYVVVKKEYILFLDDKDNEKIRCVYQFDNNVNKVYQSRLTNHKIVITNLKQKISIKSSHKGRMKILREKLWGVLENSNHKEKNRFDSFSPIRENTPLKVLVDGKNYFRDLYDGLIGAKKEIYIAGWWVYSDVYLRRKVVAEKSVDKKSKNKEKIDTKFIAENIGGVNIEQKDDDKNKAKPRVKLNKKYRLDNVLLKKAKEGIKIYVLLYREFEIALTINSAYTMHKFLKLHKNIQVFRHPNFVNEGLICWSHHEKVVVIDQRLAYVGGIDLCLGRYDDKDHSLFDAKPENEEDHEMKHIQSRTKQKNEIIASKKINDEKLINKEKNKVVDENVTDDKHQASKDDIISDDKMKEQGKVADNNVVDDEKNVVNDEKFDNDRDTIGEEIQIDNKEPEEQEDTDFWPGNDFSNPLKKDFDKIGIEYASLIDRAKTPRMPWHDVHCKVGGYAAIDLSRHFIERWNRIRANETKFDYLIPLDENYANFDDIKFKAQTQILRSIGQWTNRYVVERSIRRAYEDLIINSKKFLYLENQFFITKCVEVGQNPENTLGICLLNRIKQAFINKEDFKIYIVIPLLPAFEADLESTTSNIQEVMRAQTESIVRTEKSIFRALSAEGIDPSRYILFLSLRNGSIEKGRIVSELVYVHSKLMIADGIRTIIGSANFNDRSMCGDRDSELAILVENDDGFGFDLLKRLLKEHLGISKKNIDVDIGKMSINENKNGDRIPDTEENANKIINEAFKTGKWKNLGSDEIFHAIKQRARTNTNLFRDLFRVTPDNKITSKKKLKTFAKIHGKAESMSHEELTKTYGRIHGHFVIYPCYFLAEDVAEDTISSELVPKYIFY